MKKFNLILIGIFMCLVAASVSVAATIEYNDDLDEDVDNLGGGYSNLYSGVMEVAQFKPSQGVLTSAKLTVQSSYGSDLLVSVDGYKTVTWNHYSGIMIQSHPIIPENSVVATNYETHDYFVPGSLFIYGPRVAVNNEFLYSSEDSLEPFIGNDTLKFYLMAFSVDQLCLTVPDYADAYSTFFNNIYANVKVTYNYTPAPLPSALIFLISGLAAVVGFKRFKAARD